MPFPVEEKYIIQTETELEVKFPPQFRNRMIKVNGGELFKDTFEFELYPFFDKSSRKMISRTCNHIGLETKKAREWSNFPDNGIAIAADGLGNQLILTHNGDGKLEEELYVWDHEIGQVKKIAETINEFKE